MAQPPVSPERDDQPRLSPIDIRNTQRLLESLKALDDRANIFTLDEFRRYAPLYVPQMSDVDSDTISPERAALAREFFQRINLYKPTHIVRSKTDPEILLRLPQLMVQLSTLAPTPENEQAVLTNYSHRLSDLPKVWSRAQNLMSVQVFKQQNSKEQLATFARTRTETAAIMTEFFEKTGREPPENLARPSPPSEAGLAADDFDDL
jgi:hypothetical protein